VELCSKPGIRQFLCWGVITSMKIKMYDLFKAISNKCPIQYTKQDQLHPIGFNDVWGVREER
jgi:hypothetical protein